MQIGVNFKGQKKQILQNKTLKKSKISSNVLQVTGLLKCHFSVHYSLSLQHADSIYFYYGAAS
jgi:hypothetical protein